MGIVLATVCVAAVGLFVGVFLSVAGKAFFVEVDEREIKVADALPGANCGGCGQAGCSAMAHAIVTGAAPVNGCPVGGDSVAAKIAEIMGQTVTETEPAVAFVKCYGTCTKAKNQHDYTGVADCKIQAMVPGGGAKACAYGCLGGGTCERVCPFDAIHVVDGIAVVDEDKCKACGKCVENCPRHVIELKPKKNTYAVACSSKDKGPAVMKVCAAGCIGCGLCARNCPEKAIEVTDFIAHIDYDKCKLCGICAEKCPKKVILKLEKPELSAEKAEEAKEAPAEEKAEEKEEVPAEKAEEVKEAPAEEKAEEKEEVPADEKAEEKKEVPAE